MKCLSGKSVRWQKFLSALMLTTMPGWLTTSRFAKLERGNTKDIPEEK